MRNRITIARGMVAQLRYSLNKTKWYNAVMEEMETNILNTERVDLESERDTVSAQISAIDDRLAELTDDHPEISSLNARREELNSQKDAIAGKLMRLGPTADSQ